MSKHPSEMTIGELMGLRAVNTARGGQIVSGSTLRTGRYGRSTRGLGETWARVGAGYDLDKRTLPYMLGPGFTGKRHGFNPAH